MMPEQKCDKCNGEGYCKWCDPALQVHPHYPNLTAWKGAVSLGQLTDAELDELLAMTEEDEDDTRTIVAKAIKDADPSFSSWDDTTDAEKEIYRRIADKAIAAYVAAEGE